MLRDKFFVALCAILIVVVSAMAIFRPKRAPRDLSTDKRSTEYLSQSPPFPKGDPGGFSPEIESSEIHGRGPAPSPKIEDAPRTVAKNAPGAHSLRQEGPFVVERVLDGDTLRLDNGETVRLIGVDAPETKHPELPVQRFGQEAAEFLRRMVEGFEVVLEIEPGEERDKYDRLLAYVWLEDRMANAEIVRRGYAYAYRRFPFRRMDQFLSLEREARDRQCGLWHLSLRDGRIANLVRRYDSLSLEGRRELDDCLDRLVKEYPYSPPGGKEAGEP